MIKNLALILGLAGALGSNYVLAIPREIIIVRHADKWLTPASKWANPANIDLTLNAKGMIRSVKLAQYILKNFGKPDFIFATLPMKPGTTGGSIRTLQTAGPLASMLAESNPHGFEIRFPYLHQEYAALGKIILTDHEFDKKTILIIWNHKDIPDFVHFLGVKNNLPQWPQNNFDSVYVLHYADEGHLMNWKRLDNQYPVSDNVHWDLLSSA